MSSRVENGKNGAVHLQMVDDSFPRETAVPAAPGLPTHSLKELTEGCPYFGSAEDPATRFLFASPAGACYRAEPSALVSLAQQQAFCLTAQHTECPVFRGTEAGPLPADLHAEMGNGRSPGGKRVGVMAAVVVLVLLTAVTLFFWNASRGQTAAESPAAVVIVPSPTAPAAGTATEAASPVPEAAFVAPATAVPTATPTTAPTNTAAPLPTATSSPTAVPLLVVNVPTLNVRQGPGTDYPLLGAITQSEEYEITGQSFNGSWWQICCVAGEPGWVIGEAVTVTGDTANVPTVRVAPATETGEP